MSTDVSLSHTVLPAPVEDALRRLHRVRPEEATDAVRALTEALEPVHSSRWPDVAWRSSTLTGTGLPVELAWASRDTALRWTCEVAGPETPEAERLALCGEAVGRLTGASIDLAPWAALQTDRSLRWGAWLGMRHRGSSRAAKAYVELPTGAVLPSPWAHAARDVTRDVTGRMIEGAPGLTWRMAGCNVDGTVELYARVPALAPGSLLSLGSLVGHPQGFVELVGALLTGVGDTPRESWRPPTPSVMPRPSGLSVTLSPDGTPLAVTWFCFAKALWSSDALAVQAITGLAARVDGPDPARATALYRALAAGDDDGRWHHAMVGVGVDLTGQLWLQVGLRP